MSASAATSPFRHRGLVEGFYGTPWSHADRLWWVARAGRLGLNTFVVAPKDEPLLGAEWRTPFPPELLERFRELVEAGSRCGVRVGFALSPGLSIRYAEAGERDALFAKFARLEAIGVRFHTLALDDVASELQHPGDRARFRSLAEAQLLLLRELRERLDPASTLWLVPTEYAGLEPSQALARLGEGLPEGVEVAWTGRSVFSPRITSEEVARRAEALGRPLLLFDNVPVTDGPLRILLQLGAYQGRDPGLARHCSGILLNPMQHAHASAVMLGTAAAWMAQPETYQAEASWEAVVEELGAGAPEAFRCFARAHRFGPLSPEDRDLPLEAALRGLADSGPAADRTASQAVEALLEERLAAAETLRRDLQDRQLLAEIEPWLTAHHDETRRMHAASKALVQLRAADLSELARCLALVRMEGALTRIPQGVVTSYGPRRLLVPQLASMRERNAHFGTDPTLFIDHSLAETWIDFVEEEGLRVLGGELSRGRPFGARSAAAR